MSEVISNIKSDAHINYTSVEVIMYTAGIDVIVIVDEE